MYPSTRFSSSTALPTITQQHIRISRISIFQVFFSIFALPAFVFAEGELQPYENNRFLNAYATLQQPSAQVFENISLRNALRNIQSASGVAIWLDRRIDGEQIIQLKPGKRSQFECVSELCRQTNTETAWLENILYIAPSHQSTKIETAYWKLFTSHGSDAWQKKGQPIQWTIASDTEAILEKFSRTLPLKLGGLDRLEHDVWGPSTIPEASIAAQWICLLAGFNNSLQIDAQKRWQITELPEVSDVMFVYVKQLAKINAKRLEEWRAKWPSAKVSKLRNGSTSITATVEAHRELIAASIKLKEGQPNKDAPWSLEYKGELGKLLEALAKQLEFTIVPWPFPPDLATKHIEINVKDAPIDKLLEAISHQAGITFMRVGNNVTFEVP